MDDFWRYFLSGMSAVYVCPSEMGAIQASFYDTMVENSPYVENKASHK